MTAKLVRSVLDSGRHDESGHSSGSARSSGSGRSSEREPGRPRGGRFDLPAGWSVVGRGHEPNVHEPVPDEDGWRIVAPHLDAAISLQPVFVDGLFEQRLWRVALQAKRKFWDTGDQYVYETLREECFDNRREVDTALEGVIQTLAATTDLSELRLDADPAENA